MAVFWIVSSLAGPAAIDAPGRIPGATAREQITRMRRVFMVVIPELKCKGLGVDRSDVTSER
jgi:hypothetical protein